MGDKGAGDGFDLCECICSHELAMARLLNVVGPSAVGGSTPPENLYLMAFVIGVALLLFFFRPRPQVIQSQNKPVDKHNWNDAPPAPPIN